MTSFLDPKDIAARLHDEWEDLQKGGVLRFMSLSDREYARWQRTGIVPHDWMVRRAGYRDSQKALERWRNQSEAEKRLEAIKVGHWQGSDNFCIICEERWPCETYQVANGDISNFDESRYLGEE